MQRLNSVLKSAALDAHAAKKQEATAAQSIWQQIAPDNLATLSSATALNNAQLFLTTPHNVVAAKIKLLIPSLLIQLQNQGHKVTAISVKVQVKSSPQVKPKPIKTISQPAADTLNAFAEGIAGTPLADILKKLARHTR